LVLISDGKLFLHFDLNPKLWWMRKRGFFVMGDILLPFRCSIEFFFSHWIWIWFDKVLACSEKYPFLSCSHWFEKDFWPSLSFNTHNIKSYITHSIAL
jgi:hypothetical protein